MTKITRIGIDLGKSTFHVYAVDRSGQVVVEKKFTRRALERFMAEQAPCLVGLEACGGAHHWARVLRALGHDARLMSPQFVKPYVKSNKNDFRDAEAICEAVSRPTMRFVPVKSAEQQDLQHLHRIRSQAVAQRTAVVNQVRGFPAPLGESLSGGRRHRKVVHPFGFSRRRCRTSPGEPSRCASAHTSRSPPLTTPPARSRCSPRPPACPTGTPPIGASGRGAGRTGPNAGKRLRPCRGWCGHLRHLHRSVAQYRMQPPSALLGRRRVHRAHRFKVAIAKVAIAVATFLDRAILDRAEPYKYAQECGDSRN